MSQMLVHHAYMDSVGLSNQPSSGPCHRFVNPFHFGLRGNQKNVSIGVRFGWFGWNIEGPGLPGGSIIYQGHLFFKKDTCEHQPFVSRGGHQN